jgi:hypothetical protein
MFQLNGSNFVGKGSGVISKTIEFKISWHADQRQAKQNSIAGCRYLYTFSFHRRQFAVHVIKVSFKPIDSNICWLEVNVSPFRFNFHGGNSG